MACCPLATRGFMLPALSSGQGGHLASCPQHAPGPGTIQAQGAPDSLSRGMSSQMSQIRREDAKGPPDFRRNALVADFSGSYKLYYVNYEIWLDLPAWARASPLSYFLSAL